MSKKMTKKQHYVPQFYLRNFCDSKGKLYVYDKKEKKYIYCLPKEICYEKYLYETEWKDSNPIFGRFIVPNHIEDEFAKRETEYSELLKRIILLCEKPKNKNALICSSRDKDILAEFAVNLLVRNPDFLQKIDFESLESFKKGNIVYKELLDDLGLDYESLCKAAVIKSFLSKEIEKSFSKDIAESLKSEYPQIYKKIKEVCDAADDFNTDFTEMVKILRNMNFSIYKSSEENFITTNVPVYCTFKDETLVGDNESSLKSLCFPISPNLYVFYCSEKLLRRNRTIEMSKKDVHDINMQFCELPCDIVRFFISKDKKTLEKICKD